jgi:glutathione S-transferase
MNSPQLILCELADAGIPRVESYSPFCLKVHRALALAGFGYERRHASRPDAFRKYNPAGQVPVLLIDGVPVFDSTEIVSRIDFMSGGALCRGLDRRARAEAFLWEEMADTTLNGFLVAARWLDDENWPKTKAAYFAAMPGLVRAIVPGRLRSGVRKRLEAGDVVRSGLDACWMRFETTLDELEARAPSRGFWLGDVASRADIALFGQLWSFQTELTSRQAGSVGRRPRLSAWLERVDHACRRVTTASTVEPATETPRAQLRAVGSAFA